MGLTDNCDIYLKAEDGALNSIFRSVFQQRPSLFNYATPWFARNLGNFCVPLPHPLNGAPTFTPLPAQSSGSAFSLVEAAIQIDCPGIAFLPANPDAIGGITLPFHLRLAIPDISINNAAYPGSGLPTPGAWQLLDCVAMGLTGQVELFFKVVNGHCYLGFYLKTDSITGIQPDPLRSMVEAYLKYVVNEVLLPGVWQEIKPLVFPVSGHNIQFTISPTGRTPNPNSCTGYLEGFFSATITS
jgi:hypothetical protein